MREDVRLPEGSLVDGVAPEAPGALGQVETPVQVDRAPVLDDLCNALHSNLESGTHTDLRIKGNRFQPKVFAQGKYTINIDDGAKKKTLQGIQAGDKSTVGKLTVKP